MRLPFFLLLLSAVLLLGIGCEDANTGVFLNPPRCELRDLTSTGGAAGQSPTLVITVENTSGVSDAFFVQAQVEAKLGDTVVDSGLATFGNLEPGQTATENAVLTGIERHDAYDRLEIKLVWADAEGALYEEDFVR